ncbi:MAG: 6-phospho-beta-glucosidase [Oscillospiraceae bacterium]|nr:6-phospho-beta-glucosidase [Oscillospiraceae bacterium]
MKEINVTVIGSGSTYCPELVDGFIQRQDSLKLKRLVLMDIDDRKRNIVGDLCARMIKKAGLDTEVVLSDCLDSALERADFVVTQIRVGKLPARYLDESIPVKYDLIGQETTGIGGMFKALRTIPVMAEICKKIEEICPDAWLINFTNPSGIITDFVLNNTKVKCMGLCNVPIDMLDDIKENVGGDADITYLGLNHLSWVTSVKKDGVELMDKLFTEGFAPKVMANIVDDGFDLDCLRACGGWPSSYLQYFYNRDAKLKHLKEDKKTRARTCMEIEEQLLKMYKDEELCVKPALLDKRGGHKYSLAACSLIDSIANDKKEVHVVNILNKGTLPFMADDDVVEISAVIGADGAVPVKIEPHWNRHIISLMTSIKAYEKYTIEAALTGNDIAAYNAMMVHPLIGDYARSRSCYEEMKDAHREFLPEFIKEK